MKQFSAEKANAAGGVESDQEKVLRDRFKEQFSKFETLNYKGADFEMIDLTPEAMTDTVPVVFVPGFGKSPRSYEEALFEVYKSGRRVLGMTAPTKNFVVEKKKDTIPNAQAMRAEALTHMLDAKGVGLADVIGHSEGAMNAAIAASEAPERFRHFVFVALPGVTDEQSYFEIAKRGVQRTIYEKGEMKNADAITKTRYERAAADIRTWIKGRGALKGTIESMNPGRMSIADEVRALHESGHGVSIISGVEDKMLPMNEYQRDKTDTPRSASDLGVDGFYSIKKGHSELEVNDRVGALAAHALSALGKKYKKSSETTSAFMDPSDTGSEPVESAPSEVTPVFVDPSDAV